MFPWILCIVLCVIIFLLLYKIYTFQKSIEELCASFREHLSEDTNTLLTVSSGNRHIRRLASEINEQLRELRRQRRNYMQGDLELKEAITDISHDLRTPLTAISGYLELLDKEEKSETVKRYLSYVENRTNTLKSLTEELFRYTIAHSAEKTKLEPVDIRSVLEESLLDFYSAFADKEISPVLSITNQPVIRPLNRPALSRVFGNIFQNALKYGDGDLSVSLNESGEILFVNSASSLDQVQAEKLFHRFFTVENARNSTGLGLSIARMLTEKMQGDITASWRNERLYVRIQFPVPFRLSPSDEPVSPGHRPAEITPQSSLY